MYDRTRTINGLAQLPVKINVLMAAGIIILLGGIFFGIVLAYYLVAKISLAMVLLIGPLF